MHTHIYIYIYIYIQTYMCTHIHIQTTFTHKTHMCPCVYMLFCTCNILLSCSMSCLSIFCVHVQDHVCSTMHTNTHAGNQIRTCINSQVVYILHASIRVCIILDNVWTVTFRLHAQILDFTRTDSCMYYFRQCVNNDVQVTCTDSRFFLCSKHAIFIKAHSLYVHTFSVCAHILGMCTCSLYVHTFFVARIPLGCCMKPFSRNIYVHTCTYAHGNRNVHFF